MDSWNDDEWPMNIRKKDEEQKQFHKSVTTAFFLMLDGNEQTLSLDTIRDLCRLQQSGEQVDHPQRDRLIRDFLDEDYGQMLDVIEGLKIGLAAGQDFDDAPLYSADEIMAELTGSLGSQDEAEPPFFRLADRRTTKPS